MVKDAMDYIYGDGGDGGGGGGGGGALGGKKWDTVKDE